ncbi:MAG TPA: DUF3828 domain-containing protein [Reyranella sp.]|nr:DUF3828 domain-containing protein [Reyranella sp.]
MLRRALIAALAIALPVAAAAQTLSAQDFLKSIYEPYQKEGFKGQPYWESKRFFAPDLAAAIDKDMELAKKKNEVPLLDGDPFIDAQDWKITSISQGVVVEGDKAAAGVAFVNLGEPKSVALKLAKTPDGWRILDIVTEGGSLRALYKLKP